MPTYLLAEIHTMRRSGFHVPTSTEIAAVVDAITSEWPDVSLYKATHENGVDFDDEQAIKRLIKDERLSCTVTECVTALYQHVLDKMGELDPEPPEDDVQVVVEVSRNEVNVGDQTYWCPPAGGGYVRLVTGSNHGALALQVCDGLAMRGETLKCSGEPLLTTILREMPQTDGLVVVQLNSCVGPRIMWRGEVSTERLNEVEAELSGALEGWRVDWSNTVTIAGGSEKAAPIVEGGE